MIVLIPSYEPNDQLVSLVGALRSADQTLPIVIVNDGSSPAFDSVYEAARTEGVTVVQHPHNLGKGRALKTGFAHIAECFPGADVVCADSDGQHRIGDILRVADALHGRDATIVLGSRGWTGDVPFKSRFGNSLTRLVFRASTGRRVADTQTGLRAYPASMLPWLQAIEGERFEYEMSVLLDATKAGFAVEEVAIDTVYMEGNESTHFRPLVDSFRVYVPFLKFSLSSLVSFVVDIVALFLFNALFDRLLPAVVTARALSSIANFSINRLVVFRHQDPTSLRQSASRYFALAIGVLIANYALLHLLHERLRMALLAAKLLTEVGLFVAGFQVQRRFVFGRSKPR
jgi:putative flippase GtrA